jgi:DNA-binding NtrC family response regulator
MTKTDQYQQPNSIADAVMLSADTTKPVTTNNLPPILTQLKAPILEKFDKLYSDIETEAREEIKYEPTSLDAAEAFFEKTYLQQRLADESGVKSRVDNYRTVHRKTLEHGLEKDPFSIEALNQATPEERSRLEGKREDIESKLYEATNPITSEAIRDIAYQRIEAEKESDPQFYALAKQTIDSNLDTIAQRVNYNPDVINLNTLVRDAIKFSEGASLKEAKDNFRSLFVAYNLHRNNGNVNTTAEEIGKSTKTVKRAINKIKDKQSQLRSVFEQYITEHSALDPTTLVLDLQQLAFRQLTGQESQASLN